MPETQPDIEVAYFIESRDALVVPRALARHGESVAVSDRFRRRVRLLSQTGDPLQTLELTHEPDDLAFHPRLGLLTTLRPELPTIGSRPADHYLQAATTGSPLAPIPVELASEVFGPRFNHRVAVSADGRFHVLDNEHLALVSYSADGHLTGWAYLPRDVRNALLEAVADLRRDGRTRRYTSIATISKLSSLPEGGLFIATGHEIVRGFVLDSETREAAPIVLRDSSPESRIMSFDGQHAVLVNSVRDLSLHRVTGVR